MTDKNLGGSPGEVIFIPLSFIPVSVVNCGIKTLKNQKEFYKRTGSILSFSKRNYKFERFLKLITHKLMDKYEPL